MAKKWYQCESCSWLGDDPYEKIIFWIDEHGEAQKKTKPMCPDCLYTGMEEISPRVAESLEGDYMDTDSGEFRVGQR